MNFKTLCATLSTLLLCSCATYEVTYTLELKDVITPNRVNCGKIEVLAQRDTLGPHYSYTDNNIHTKWRIGRHSIYFYIKNLTNSTMRFEETGIGYADIFDRCSNVYGTPAAAILPGLWCDGSLLPTNNVVTIGSRSDTALLIPSIYSSENKMKKGAPQMLGKTLKVMLPIMHNDTLKEYIFIFEITDYALDSFVTQERHPFYSGRSK